jgi:hypothetical protein
VPPSCLRYTRRVAPPTHRFAVYVAGYPRAPALSHFSRNTEAGSNMLDRPVNRLAFMSCFIATPLLYPVGNEPLGLCTGITPPSFGWLRRFLAVPSVQPIRLRRYAHHRTGCFTCSTPRRIAARCRMHPSYCFHGTSRYSPMTPPLIKGG